MSLASEQLHGIQLTGEQVWYLREALSQFVVASDEEQKSYQPGGCHWEMYDDQMRAARAILLKVSNIDCV